MVFQKQYRKHRQEVAKQIHAKGSVNPMDRKTKDFIRIILSLIIPPVGVFFQVGFGLHFWLNIILTLFGYVPGLLHAIWVIVKKN